MNCNLASSPLDNNANLLISVADVYGMQQLITDPTRCTKLASTLIGHTSKPGPDPDSDSKKIRTREKPGPGLEKNPDSCLTKPGLDF